MPSKAYRTALAEASRHHQRSKTYSGRLFRPHKRVLVQMVGRLGIQSALDYGCGKGEQYSWRDPRDGRTIEEAFGFAVRRFDPAWPAFALEPAGEFDLVICTHVLGSVPVEDLPWVLDRLFGYARKAVFIAERIGEVKKGALSRPDLRPVGWSVAQWRELIGRHSPPGIETILSTTERRGEAKITERRRFCGWGWAKIEDAEL